MLKKRAAIFLLTAFAIMLGHSIIPHHHHTYEHKISALQFSHEHHDHDNDENRDDDLGHLFSHFIHPVDNFTFTTTHINNISFAKQLFLFVAVLPGNFSLKDFHIPRLLLKPPAEHLNFISPYSLSSGLRAPPAIFI